MNAQGEEGAAPPVPQGQTDLPPMPEPPPLPEMPEVTIQEMPGFVVQTGPDMNAIAPLIAVVVAAVLAVILLFPLIRAWARRIEGRGADPELRGELEELRARLGEVEQHQVRVAELEERLDFAERLLAQQRAPDRIGPA